MLHALESVLVWHGFAWATGQVLRNQLSAQGQVAWLLLRCKSYRKLSVEPYPGFFLGRISYFTKKKYSGNIVLNTVYNQGANKGSALFAIMAVPVVVSYCKVGQIMPQVSLSSFFEHRANRYNSFKES